MGSVFDFGGYIGKDVSLYAPTYDEAIAGTLSGPPTFRWTFNNTTDEVGNHTTNVNGTFSYSSGLIPSIPSQSANLDGSTTWLQPANSAFINFGTGYAWTKRSISFWFNADTTSSWRAIWEEGGGANWMAIYLNDNLLYANLGENSVSGGHAAASVSAGVTYHCLVTFDLALASNNIKIYLNGELAAEANSSVGTDLASHGADNRIGHGAARNHTNTNNPYTIYDGRMQDFCYWYEEALTLSDAQNIYNAGINDRPSSGIFNLKAVSRALFEDGIVTDGLILHLDPANSLSYNPETSTTIFKDLVTKTDSTIVNDVVYETGLYNVPVFSINSSVNESGNAINNSGQIQVATEDLDTLALTQNFSVMFVAKKNFYGFGGNNFGNSQIFQGVANGYTTGWRIVEGRTGTPGNPFSERHRWAFGYNDINTSLSVQDFGSSVNRMCIVAFTVSPTTIFGFCNGTTSSINNPGTYASGSSLPRISWTAAGGGSFNGLLGNFFIYNKTLSIEEIQQNFKALRGRYGI